MSIVSLVSQAFPPRPTPISSMPHGALTFANFRDVVLMLAAASTAGAAWRGLYTWKQRLTGEAEYGLAKRILRLCFQYRDAVADVRNPFMTGYEMHVPADQAPEKLDEREQHFRGVSNAYMNRWKPVQAVKADLYPESLEAEVHWGSQLDDLLKPLFKLERRLFVALDQHLRSLDPRSHGADEVQESAQRRAIIYSRGDEHDAFDTEFKNGLDAIAGFLREKLKK